MRIGIGFDIHKVAHSISCDQCLILGGVEIDCGFYLVGHSDADALIHSLIDALIGASGLGDIGVLFPDTDNKYLNIDSRLLLRETIKLIELNTKYYINNIDANIIIDRPKLRPYIDLMRKNLSNDLNININQINIKAKTTENILNNTSIITQTVVLLNSN